MERLYVQVVQEVPEVPLVPANHEVPRWWGGERNETEGDITPARGLMNN